MGDTGHIELDDLRDKLSVKRNGVVLNRKVVSLLAEFAVSTLEVVDEKELMDLGPDGLEAAIGEAWDSEDVPRAFVSSHQAGLPLFAQGRRIRIWSRYAPLHARRWWKAS